MSRRNLTIMRTLFVVMSAITLLIIILFLLNSPENQYELIISVCSIFVTAVLGITTYYQTAEQNRIDMFEKTPYLRLVYDEFDIKKAFRTTEVNEKGGHKNDFMIRKELSLVNNKKTINVTGCNGRWVLTVKVTNAGDVTIKSIRQYFCEGDYREDNNKFFKLSDSGRFGLAVEAFANDNNQGEFLKRLENYTFENSDLKPNDEIVLDVIVSDPIGKDRGNYVTYSFAFEMDSIHGYTYTQYFVITVTFSAFVDDVKLQIVNQEIDIQQGNIRKRKLT